MCLIMQELSFGNISKGKLKIFALCILSFRLRPQFFVQQELTSGRERKKSGEIENDFTLRTWQFERFAFELLLNAVKGEIVWKSLMCYWCAR